MFEKIGIIGCGNMGGAIASALSKNDGGSGLYLSNRTRAKAEALAGRTGGHVAANGDIARECDLIFIAVKPRYLAEMLGGIREILAARTDRFVIASVVTGVTAARLRELAGGEYPVVRLMPNTPSSVGAGMIQYCSAGVTDEELSDFCGKLKFAGELDALPEDLLDAASAVSGAGPAFLCLALEGMADGGVALGLPRDKALKYAAATIMGLGKLALETGEHPGVMKDRVTSPGGTTIEGIRKLEEKAVRSAFTEAVIAVSEKTEKLKKNT